MDYEPIDVIVDWDLGYLEGSAVKHIARAKSGDELSELTQARYYLDRRIAILETKGAVAGQTFLNEVPVRQVNDTPVEEDAEPPVVTNEDEDASEGTIYVSSSGIHVQ